MPEAMERDGMVESKVITYKQPHEGLQFPMILTALDTDHTDFGGKSGFRGEYVMFTITDGGVQECFHDPYSTDYGLMNGELKRFALEVRAGYTTDGETGIPWDELENDGVYSREDFSSV